MSRIQRRLLLPLLLLGVGPALTAAPAASAAPHEEAALFAGLVTSVRADAGRGLFVDLPLPAVDGGPGSRLPVAAFTAPRRLRPCCAFGEDLGVAVLGLRLPGVRVDNLADPAHLGHHHYDAGVLALDNAPERAFVSGERNGLVYTRRGGFVDVAHVRQWADWTVYLAQEVAARLPDGGTVELPDEGGARRVRIQPLQPDWLRQVGPDEAAVALAEWLAFQLSVWHEVATLYGWSTTPLFPERVSAFSPEDLYSNLLGVQLAGAILRAGGAETRERWEHNVDAALPELLRRLGVVGRDDARRAAESVDGFWWDSQRPLPDPDLVLRRNAELGPTLVPWRVSLPRAARPASGARGVGAGRAGSRRSPGPAVLRVPDRVHGRADGSLARLEVVPSAPVARAMPASLRAAGELTQDDFASAVQLSAAAPR